MSPDSAAAESPSTENPSAERHSTVQVPFDPAKPPTTIDVLKNLKVEEFKPDNLSRLPCLKKSMLYGLAAGSSMGLVRFAVKRSPRSAGDWAMATFAVVAVSSWEFCRFQRRLVQKQMDALVNTNEAEGPSAAKSMPQ
ncbi:uncharacterized protein BJ171DRAFT_1636 [Polychytrium aggregatum]|uniref:uncharacterized protein n=1 Tax=Polychytrium aggregatum TaxID=110093 RepID=UPI0022FE1B83|nr:uncharacterized protein BJ171DRAFT_1636 [Polychytrium aggregatum]KAI9209553.1 hypothetical protein BJ171DRAFT_1636 [Polychytrium aggregatum]